MKIPRTLCFLVLFASSAFAQLQVTDDTYVTSASPTSINGTSPSLVVQTPGGLTLIRFDLSQLTNAGVTPAMISKAYVKVYLTAVTAQGKFDAYAVNATWGEKTVTYNTRPALGAAVAGATGINVTTASSYVIIDITALLQSWLSGAQPNYGLALGPSTGSSISATAESKESTTTGHVSELEILFVGSLLNGSTTVLSFNGRTGAVTPLAGDYSLSQLSGNLLEAQVMGLPSDLMTLQNHIDGEASTRSAADNQLQTNINNEAVARQQGDAATLTSANSHTDTSVTNEAAARQAGDNTLQNNVNSETAARSAADASEAAARIAADAATLASANGHSDASVAGEAAARLAAGALKANLAGGNMFTGGTQKLAPATPAFASLNLPGTATPPSAPAPGDFWLLNGDVHLQFQDALGHTQMFAFTTDVSSLSSNLQTQITNEVTNRQTADNQLQTNINNEATARQQGDVDTLASANSHTDTSVANETSARQASDTTLQNNINNEAGARQAADNTLQTNINNETANRQAADTNLQNNINAESMARAAGDAATLVSANGYTDISAATEAAARQAADAGKANKDGGNIFTGGKQTLAAATASYASLNLPGTNAAVSSPAKGDFWLLNGDVHVQFQDEDGNTRSLAFTNDTLNGTFRGNGSGLISLNASNLSTGTVGVGRLAGTYNIDISGNAATATHADNADHASSADNATHAASADNATHATSADSATNADHAINADHATNADNANHATSADSATHADNADNAGFATSA